MYKQSTDKLSEIIDYCFDNYFQVSGSFHIAPGMSFSFNHMHGNYNFNSFIIEFKQLNYLMIINKCVSYQQCSY